MSWAAACPDWAARIKARASLLPDLPWIEPEAARALAIFSRLRLPDVPGKPMIGEDASPWLTDTVRGVFGSYDRAANVRHLREFFVLVPKKNAKTTGGAAIMVTALAMSPRPRAEFTLIAPTIAVAELAFAQAVGMIEADPFLAAKCHIRDHRKEIIWRTTESFLRIKSFDPKTVTGGKPAGVLLDEIHVIAEQHNADRVIGQLRGGLISQPEAFLLMTTTQSESPPAGVFLAELNKARAVRDGRLVAPMLPLLWEFPDGVDWRDPTTWSMVNPGDGYSLDVARLVEDFQAADVAGIGELRRWASQHLNVEIGLALKSDAWAGAQFWQDQARHLPLEMILELSDVIEVGIDGGGLDDMLGLAVLGREATTGDWLLWSHAWLHPIALERRKVEAARFRDFEAQGDLTIVDRVGDDVADVVALVERVADTGKLDKVGVDPVGIGGIVTALVDAGIAQDDVLGIPQGWRLSGAIKTTERKLAEGALHHGGAPLMNWAVGNAKVEPRGNAVTITKAAAGFCKIDPLSALFDAAALMSMNPAPRLHVDDWIG
jgi:phage terminase large subunit-like protein